MTSRRINEDLLLDNAFDAKQYKIIVSLPQRLIPKIADACVACEWSSISLLIGVEARATERGEEYEAVRKD
jgi:hypothetical protein